MSTTMVSHLNEAAAMHVGPVGVELFPPVNTFLRRNKFA